MAVAKPEDARVDRPAEIAGGGVAFKMPDNEMKLEYPVPLLWRIMVEPLKLPESSRGGIALPEEVRDSAKHLTNIGKVIAMGSMCYQSNTKSGVSLADEPFKPRIGSWVMYGRYSGQRVSMRDGREYIFINDDEIIAVINDTSAYKQYV